MKIGVVGSGGREHAICWRLKEDGHEVLAFPGNDAIASIAKCHPMPESQGAFAAQVKELGVELVVIGPEVPLVAGLADVLRQQAIPTFGPGASAAKLEGSKRFSKEFFEKYGIRSAGFSVCRSMQDVEKAIEQLGGQLVVKADGLAGGKGVVVCSTAVQVRTAARSMLEENKHGEAGRTLLVEERIHGRELSVMALCDGKRYEFLAPAEDHKTLLEDDVGPNTGGMGTVSPPAWVSKELLGRIDREVFAPTLDGLIAEGFDFRGVLYAGIMVDADGAPWLLEYNVRFGDPETQPVLSRLRGDFGQWLLGVAQGAMPEGTPQFDDDCALCVVLAAHGYPYAPRKGDVIEGLDRASEFEGVQIFHSGTRVVGKETITAGGRVLGICARGTDLHEARSRAYSAGEQIHFSGQQFRRDIGLRGEKK